MFTGTFDCAYKTVKNEVRACVCVCICEESGEVMVGGGWWKGAGEVKVGGGRASGRG